MKYRILHNKTRNYYIVQSRWLGFWHDRKYSTNPNGPNCLYKFLTLEEAKDFIKKELKTQEPDDWEVVKTLP